MEGVGEVVEVMAVVTAAEQGSGGGPVISGGWGVRLGGRKFKLRRDLLGGDAVPGPVWRRLSRRRP